MEKAFTLVEQGIYTLEVFKERREKLTNSIDEIKDKKRELSKIIKKMEKSDTIHSNLVPQTEKLLESYNEMSVDERNKILKEVLYKIVYKKESKGKICIDLYPRLPRILCWYHRRTHVFVNDPTRGYGIFIENMLAEAGKIK